MMIKKEVTTEFKVQSSLIRYLKKEWRIYTFLILPIAYFILFKYVPMFGNIIAFRRYRPGSVIWGDQWVGFRYFKQLLGDANFWMAFRNTLTLSVSYLVVRFPLVLIFALLLNEVRTGYAKRFVQTVSYLPHFISMVILCGMIKEIVSLNGPINSALKAMGYAPFSFITSAKAFPYIYVLSGLWQGLGWGAILYLAAMSNINVELYEAAKIDGANRFKQIWHVTIPGILPTIITLLILDIGRIMSVNFDKVLLLYNPTTYETADVISTYMYRLGLVSANFSYAAAVGLFEAVIGLVLIVSANGISRKITDNSIW
jgi:putative aldouronate transport system permease protein